MRTVRMVQPELTVKMALRQKNTPEKESFSGVFFIRFGRCRISDIPFPARPIG